MNKRAAAQRARRHRESVERRRDAQYARINAKVSQDPNEDIRAGTNELEPLWLPFYPTGSLHGGQPRPEPVGYFDAHAEGLVIR